MLGADNMIAPLCSIQASEAMVSDLNSELGVTRDELARASAVASRATAAEAKLVKGDGMVPAGVGSAGISGHAGLALQSEHLLHPYTAAELISSLSSAPVSSAGQKL